MIALKWSAFAYPWFWRPRVSPWPHGFAVRWGYLYVLVGDEGSIS